VIFVSGKSRRRRSRITWPRKPVTPVMKIRLPARPSTIEVVAGSVAWALFTFSTTRQIMDYLPPGRQEGPLALKGSALWADTPFQVGRKGFPSAAPERGDESMKKWSWLVAPTIVIALAAMPAHAAKGGKSASSASSGTPTIAPAQTNLHYGDSVSFTTSHPDLN